METLDYDTFDEDKSTNVIDLDFTHSIHYIKLKIITSIIVILSFILILYRNNHTSTLTPLLINSIQTLQTTPSYSIAIKIESPDYGEIKSVGDLPWAGVFEPHRNQTISISSFILLNEEIDLTTNSKYDVTWILDDAIYTGNMISITLNDTGVYDATVNIYTVKGISSSYTYDFKYAVKYIRREIRTLTDADRESFFDALESIYHTDDFTGKQKYGSKYQTAEYFSYKHLTGAGKTDCDHWHDGAGIVTHHMAFTLEIEQTLQSINPAIAMPYWEYGMDTYLYNSWSESPIFNADWFGESSPINSNHKIDDGGRWAGLKVPDGDAYTEWSIAETGSLNPYVNGFGHMRSPWNNNPVQEIGRHNKTYSVTQYDTMPTCSTLQSCFKSTSLADINDCSNGATHGPVHILIGGAWGEGTLFDDDDVTMVQMPDKLLFFKVLWRMGYTRCPDTCDLGKPCKCSVPQQYIDEYGAEYILKITNVYYALEKYLDSADDDLYLKLLRAVEDPGIAGDMFSSAAAFDPSFWPLHGQIERLLGAKRIMISNGEITDFDDTWAFTEYNKASGAAYLNGVCDWSKVAGSGDLTLPTCTLDTICSGHNANDVLEFTGFLNNDEQYTNQEFYDFIHPWTEDLPYTYDTWDFDYCEEQGYEFTADSNTILFPSDGIIPQGLGIQSISVF